MYFSFSDFHQSSRCKSFGRSTLKVEWISDKRGTLCCIYMKFSHEKSSPSWHPYRYQVALPKEGINTGVQVTDSTVMRSKQIFFTLSPDGLTQFSLDHTVFIDLKRLFMVYEKVKIKNQLLTKVGSRCGDLPADG